LTAAVVFGLYAGGFAGIAKAGFFSDATSRLFGRSSTRMDLAPIVGAPPNIAKQFAQELAAAGSDNKLTITPDGTGSPYTLKGYLVATSERKGAKISYILDITDTKGQRVGRVSGEQLIARRSGADPWSGVDSAALHSLAVMIAPQIAASMSGGGSPPPAASEPSPRPAPSASAPETAAAPPAARPKGPVTTIVAPVSGAPGDGKKSLTAAIKKRLYAKGVKLATVQTGNTYTVKGTVSVTDGSGGKQSIRIDWQVLDPNGKRLGTVSQQNNIPKGSLDGPWGAIADAAAGAAADGIVKLLPKPSG
jgi:pyruvate/2-oxoglutarate dehydrogenase complex dihydrolipoamide acyltransferase (E2) component